jgi:hypothetical protein
LGCEPEGSARVEHPDGWFSFVFEPDAAVDLGEGKVLWRGARVRASAQSFERRVSHGELTALDVGVALQRRYEIEQIRGAISVAQCRFATDDAACIEGTIADEDGVVARRGAIVEHDDRFFWLEVLAADRYERELARARTTLEETFTWHR